MSDTTDAIHMAILAALDSLCRLEEIFLKWNLAPVSFGLEVFMHRFPFGAKCARMGHRAYFEHEIFTLEAPTHTGVLEHCSVAGMD